MSFPASRSLPQAYLRLVGDHDKAVELTYPTFVREQTREQMHRALSLHVYEEDVTGEQRQYFDLALNRVRSAVRYNGKAAEAIERSPGTRWSGDEYI